MLPWLLLGCPGPGPATDTPTDDTDVAAPVVVRIVTWNVQGLGSPGSDEAAAEIEVLRRIDADVVGLNEVGAEEASRLRALAAELGYDTVFTPNDNPFGGLRNGLLARLPNVEVSAVTSAAVSGDSQANDVTRLPLRLSVDLAGQPLTVVVNHYKSGFDDDDEFRRTLDGIRTAQAADEPGFVVLMGDLNAELEDMPDRPAVWREAPAGLPGSFSLGQDQRDLLGDEGLANNPFAPALDGGLEVVEARQLDGRADTRPVSGRRIDWMLVSDAQAVQSEVYDSTDEGGDGLPKAGEAPPRAASATASDHLPVFVDVTLQP